MIKVETRALWFKTNNLEIFNITTIIYRPDIENLKLYILSCRSLAKSVTASCDVVTFGGGPGIYQEFL